MTKHKDATIGYYDREGKTYAASTEGADMAAIRERFLALLPPGGRILDLGCGSGRDSKAFRNLGYEVVAMDGSKAMCSLASDLLEQDVLLGDFRTFQPPGSFQGIWACASLLHLTLEELPAVLKRMAEALVADGIFYLSFKHGVFQGNRGERHFTDLTAEAFSTLLRTVPSLSLHALWLTEDIREGREGEKWLNALCMRI